MSQWQLTEEEKSGWEFYKKDIGEILGMSETWKLTGHEWYITFSCDYLTKAELIEDLKVKAKEYYELK